MDTPTVVAVVAIGIGVGFLGGMFGKGGSAIATPLLAACGIGAFAAVASPLPATIPATLLAAYPYGRAQRIDRRVLAWTVGVGVPATVAGALASGLVGGDVLVVLTEVVLVVLGIRILAGRTTVNDADPVGPVGPDAAHAASTGPSTAPVALVAAVGGGVGLLSGLLANAGGFLLAPLFVTTLRLRLKDAFGTSLAAAAALALPGTITHAALGHIDWALTALFALSSAPLAAVGARVALRADPRRLERAYGLFLVVVAAALLVVRR